MLIVPPEQVDALLKNSDRYVVGRIVKTDKAERVEIPNSYFD